jgi:ATP-dependent RNA helicase RhlE
VPETYVHRIGRTGRAGLGGVAISFCDFDEKEYLADIENLIGKRLKEVKEHPYPLMNNFPAEKNTQPRKSGKKVIVERDDLTDKILERAMSTTNKEFSKKRDSSLRKDVSQKRDSSQPRNEAKKTDSNNKPYSSQKNSNTKKTSRPATSKQAEAPQKKKYRMTSDGTLKEKRSYSPFGRKSRSK